MAKATEGATLVVDTLAHHLRVHDREVSLERRRALEPLVVQLCAVRGKASAPTRSASGRRARARERRRRAPGASAHLARARSPWGDPAAMERVRDAESTGEAGYRLAANVRFALVEPLFSSNGTSLTALGASAVTCTWAARRRLEARVGVRLGGARVRIGAEERHGLGQCTTGGLGAERLRRELDTAAFRSQASATAGWPRAPAMRLPLRPHSIAPDTSRRPTGPLRARWECPGPTRTPGAP